MSEVDEGNAADLVPALLGDLDSVIADPLKFKLKLRIGEEAYALLRLKKTLQSLWDVGGVASTGATIAASPVVAATFFSSTGGVLAALGIGAAATPIGWIVAAALATGGAYYGVTRLLSKQTGGFVDTIPRFINTPIDLLGMQLFDLMGALVIRIARIDGEIAPEERAAIERHFVEDWGYDRRYVASAIDLLSLGSDETRVKAIARAIADFTELSPDCNAEDMQAELMGFLRQVIEADGVIDEREDLAMDAIAEVFRGERAIKLSKVGKAISGFGETTSAVVTDLGGKAGSAVAGLGARTGSAIGSMFSRKPDAKGKGG